MDSEGDLFFFCWMVVGALLNPEKERKREREKERKRE